MDDGYLYFDDTGVSFVTKVRRGAEHFEAMRGAQPKIVFINPQEEHDVLKVDDIQVKVMPGVWPNSFWMVEK